MGAKLPRDELVRIDFVSIWLVYGSEMFGQTPV